MKKVLLSGIMVVPLFLCASGTQELSLVKGPQTQKTTTLHTLCIKKWVELFKNNDTHFSFDILLQKGISIELFLPILKESLFQWAFLNIQQKVSIIRACLLIDKNFFQYSDRMQLVIEFILSPAILSQDKLNFINIFMVYLAPTIMLHKTIVDESIYQQYYRVLLFFNSIFKKNDTKNIEDFYVIKYLHTFSLYFNDVFDVYSGDISNFVIPVQTCMSQETYKQPLIEYACDKENQHILKYLQLGGAKFYEVLGKGCPWRIIDVFKILDKEQKLHVEAFTECAGIIFENAVYRDDLIPVIQMLLNRGFLPLGQNGKGHIPTRVALEHSKYEIVSLYTKALLKHYKRIEDLPPEFKGIQGILALAVNDDQAIREFLMGKTTTFPKNKDKNTLLHCAVIYKNEQMVKYLLANGASPYAVNSRQETPLHIASFGPESIVRILLSAMERDINAKDKSGHTALHNAAIANRAECVRMLLEHGADATVVNSVGFSAAQMTYSSAICKLIQNFVHLKGCVQ